MEIHNKPRYGPQMAAPKGWVGELGADQYHHTFGGDSWDMNDGYVECGKPTLLITLNLHDPRLSSLRVDALDELPLCSYINCDAWTEKQIFQIHPKARSVESIAAKAGHPEALEAEDQFPNPLPEKSIKLREMDQNEYPVNEEAYWNICDDFVGGASFIRILGPPIWLQAIEEETCICGSPMRYVGSIGYEDYDNPGGFVENRPFFIGDAALYFFLCLDCLKLVTISQPA